MLGREWKGPQVRNHRDVQVLIASGDGLMREAINRMLLDAGHIVVAEVSDGLDAVEETYSLLPDLVLMDVDMPEVDGLEAAEIIAGMCPTPVVMLTPRDSLELLDRAYGLTYVAKPPTARELEEAIASARARFGRSLQQLEDRHVSCHTRGICTGVP